MAPFTTARFAEMVGRVEFLGVIYSATKRPASLRPRQIERTYEPTLEVAPRLQSQRGSASRCLGPAPYRDSFLDGCLAESAVHERKWKHGSVPDTLVRQERQQQSAGRCKS